MKISRGRRHRAGTRRKNRTSPESILFRPQLRRTGSGASAPPAADDARHGVPINLAAALQLAGVNPLDIAAATIEVKQGLAVLLQAKVLWIPNLNARGRLFPA